MQMVLPVNRAAGRKFILWFQTKVGKMNVVIFRNPDRRYRCGRIKDTFGELFNRQVVSGDYQQSQI